MKNDLDARESFSDEALKPTQRRRGALPAGRIDLMQADPDDALDHLTQTVKLSHDPRTVAWAHIYLGRMLRHARDPDKPGCNQAAAHKAVAEYRAALASRDSQPDTKDAAERGIQQPFVLPKRAATSSAPQDNAAPSDDTPLDPPAKRKRTPTASRNQVSWCAANSGKLKLWG